MTTPQTAPPRAAPRITPRERDVLELVADGYSTAEIARALWITEDTVRTHVKRALTRLGARTRAHAVAIAFREGLWAPERRNGSEGTNGRKEGY
jgi:DNA-binding CsgD family transcriptional regulator